MVDAGTLAVYVPAALALVLAPGPDTIYVLSQSLDGGRRTGVASALGISTGVLVHTCGAALGLSVLLRESALAFRLVKYVGAAYLVYLGVRTLWASGQFDPEETGPSATADGRTGFVRGVVVNVSNPKVALFFLAFLPQFASPGGSVPLQMALLGATYAVLTLCYLAGVAYLAGSVRRLLTGSSRLERALRGVAGVAFLGLGASLAVEELAT